MKGRLWLVCAVLLPLGGQAATLEIVFESRWNDQPVTLSEPWMKRTGGDEIALTRLAYLISELRLKDSRGGEYSPPGCFGLVATGGTDRPVRIENVPVGSYTELAFSVGLNEPENRADPNQWPPDHPLNPVHSNLHWSWQGGYIFMALEGFWRAPDGGERGFSYHLGNAPHRMQVELPVVIEGTGDQVLRVRLYLDRVLGDSAAVAIPEQTSTHGREGDALAMVLKERVERAFELVEVSALDRAPENPQLMMEPSFIGTPYRFTLKRDFPVPALPRASATSASKARSTSSAPARPTRSSTRPAAPTPVWSSTARVLPIPTTSTGPSSTSPPTSTTPATPRPPAPSPSGA